MNKCLFSLLLFSIISLTNGCFAQDSTKLNIGDKAPNLVLSTAVNAIQSFNFPYKNKLMFVFFWSSSVKKSKENLYRYVKINHKYSDAQYKLGDGFEMISVAIQSDYALWQENLKKYGMSSINNCIAQKGYKDFYVKSYKIEQTPTSFLVDETGKIALINPDVKTLIDYLEQRKNSFSQPELPATVSAKILIEDSSSVSSLKNEKIYLTNEKNDTLQSISILENGVFDINTNNLPTNMYIKFSPSNQIKFTSNLYFTSEKEQTIFAITKTDYGYEGKLLNTDFFFLKPIYSKEISKITR